MIRRKIFLKNKTKHYISHNRNARIKRLKHRKMKLLKRHALQFVIQDMCKLT